jgi:parallel beta-helix repeat protein
MYLSSASNNSLVNNTCCSNYLYDGINLFLSSNNTLTNNTCSNNQHGIYLAVSSDNTISNNNCSNNYYGINLDYSSNDNAIQMNRIENNSGYGIYLYSGSNNRIWNNTFYHNNGAGDTYDSAHIQAYDDGSGNPWNGANGYGNYWSDWTTPDFVPRYGIVDVPYDIAGSAGAQDHYPLTAPQVPTEPIIEFGMMPFVVTGFLAAIMLIIGARRRKAHPS